MNIKFIVNILGGSVHTVKINKESLVVASKGIGLEVNAGKSMYTVMSRDQNARRSHNVTFDNGFFERVEESKYLGTKTFIHSFSILSDERSKASSKTMPPQSSI